MQRESMAFDVVIVGAGPSGLSAAIRIKQRAIELGREVSVCVLEKGAEVGAHILSGAVIDPRALDELIPDWKELGAPLHTAVSEDHFLLLSRDSQREIPQALLPPLMSNHGMYIISLGNLCRWLAQQAESLGVDIFPGFAAAELLYHEDGSVKGVATGDMGVGRDGQPTASYAPGMELYASYTLFAEGVRGSLGKELMERFGLRAGVDPQKYGIGLKELWQVDPQQHHPGKVVHSQGWPLGRDAKGGSFMYHLGDRQVVVGFVVHLDYTNPYLSPFEEFQRFKTHPSVRTVLEGGRRLAYGARAINEGGLQSIPKLVFPGGALIGCEAGFVNVPRIKGIHNAMKSGMLAAEAVAQALADGRTGRDELAAYPESFRASWAWQDLHRVRNVKPGLRWGNLLGTLHGGLTMWLESLGLGFLMRYTLHHRQPDHASLRPAAQCEPIAYPKADGKVSFDRLSSVFLSNTNHAENQPVHLRLKDASVPIGVNLRTYAAPEQRYCPAGVYEIVGQGDAPRLQINAQNCVHCKTCDIKDPTQNIDWKVPEGSGGPNYANM